MSSYITTKGAQETANTVAQLEELHQVCCCWSHVVLKLLNSDYNFIQDLLLLLLLIFTCAEAFK